jgi:hypothetical protein
MISMKYNLKIAKTMSYFWFCFTKLNFRDLHRGQLVKKKKGEMTATKYQTQTYALKYQKFCFSLSLVFLSFRNS